MVVSSIARPLVSPVSANVCFALSVWIWCQVFCHVFSRGIALGDHLITEMCRAHDWRTKDEFGDMRQATRKCISIKGCTYVLLRVCALIILRYPVCWCRAGPDSSGHNQCGKVLCAVYACQ
jgi:hypothetical protein